MNNIWYQRFSKQKSVYFFDGKLSLIGQTKSFKAFYLKKILF